MIFPNERAKQTKEELELQLQSNRRQEKSAFIIGFLFLFPLASCQTAMVLWQRPLLPRIYLFIPIHFSGKCVQWKDFGKAELKHIERCAHSLDFTS